MYAHIKNTRTRYEFAIESNGSRAFTLWFMERRPSLNKIYRAVVTSLDDIKRTTKTNDVQWNGDGTITAGEFTGHMTGRTLLEARGYKS